MVSEIKGVRVRDSEVASKIEGVRIWVCQGEDGHEDREVRVRWRMHKLRFRERENGSKEARTYKTFCHKSYVRFQLLD